jgi:3',5'-nucleoside bisphosphate phosphatase
MIDLHVHTTMSDGTFTPEEVVSLAARRSLKAIAITDHDTVAGVAPAQAEGERICVEVVPGVEISTQWPGGILHILGYFVRPDDPRLIESLGYLVEKREERVPQIVSLLRENGVWITDKEVERESAGGVPGRPHVARVMLHRGVVRSVQEAFDRYLKRGAPAYVEKVKLGPRTAIELITSAGGVPVMAHPYSLNAVTPKHLEDVLSELIQAGLMGIEAYYPRHSREQTVMYVELARKLGLATTGGTDFHGANKPDIKLGVIPGQPPLPYGLLQKLKERKDQVTAQFHYSGLETF